MADFDFTIPTPTGDKNFRVSSGTTCIFVGANGKTRLAVKIENDLGVQAHRISAHRALALNPLVPKISEDQALNRLWTGHETDTHNRNHHRWQNLQSITLLNDFDSLIQALFAEQSNIALDTHTKNRAGNNALAPATKFEKLKAIWERLLPHRTLLISGDNIQVQVTGEATIYKANDLSDGERAIFYLLGQSLNAKPDSLIIFDEPELHVHRGIMPRIWDEIEAARPDCAFIIITHDLEFASSRVGQKYIIRNYTSPDVWEIENVPEDEGFSENIITEILGSRKPILFVEGTRNSLDYAIYRACYPEWKIISHGSCQDIIHAVSTMRANASLTRISCAGIVDFDSRTIDEITELRGLGIYTLPVSEIENIFLRQGVATAIGYHEGHRDPELTAQLNLVITEVIANINQGQNLERAVVRFCKRRIDNALKKVDLSDAKTIAELQPEYTAATDGIDIAQLAGDRTNQLQDAINNRNIDSLASLYDNKGLISIVARHLKASKAADFESWIIRSLGNSSIPDIKNAIAAELPQIPLPR